MSNLLYPKALKTPIFCLSSSMKRVIVEKLTKAATANRKTGKMSVINSIFSEFDW